MTERPILFSGAMIRAILADYKYQTRRVVKPQPPKEAVNAVCVNGWWMWERWAPDRRHFDSKLSELTSDKRCPYGQPGDRLWVRETWCDLRGGGFGAPFAYRADSLNSSGTEDGDAKRCRLDYGYKWRPAIHMPRAASRCTLEVTFVRVQRLQEISTGDAMAEGVDLPEQFPWRPDYCPYRDSFSQLWNSINAKRGFGWDVNPWVWAVSFTRVL